MIDRRIHTAVSAAVLACLAGCAQQPPLPSAATLAPVNAAANDSEGVKGPTAGGDAEAARIYKGTGVLIRGQGAGGQLPAGPPTKSGPVVLNFEGADLREVVRNILGDILNESYTIDPNVGGQVTIRTSGGIPRDALPETLETLLRMNGATMIREDKLWKIVPQSAAVRGNVTPQLGNSTRALPAGFSVQIVPLKYVGAGEMVKILEPFAKDAQAVRADINRNLLILSGTESELRHLRETIDTFDIDWMAGMSAGIFTLHNADVKSVSQELDKVIGDKATSPFTGVLRIVPIERMNALLVISPNPEYIDKAKDWIERLDSGSGEGARFYVYNLQNQRAEHVAPLLQQAFTGHVTQTTTAPPPTVAPGTPAGTIVSPPTFQMQPTIPPNTPAASPSAAAAAGAAAGTIAATRAIGGEGIGVIQNIQVVADKDQNTILIVATPTEYSVIERALKKLDVPARQVMMEVTIAEVTLTDQLQYGVEWLFKGGAPGGRGSGGLFTGTTPFNPALTAAAGAAAPTLGLATGFNYILNNSNFLGGVQAVLNLLDTYGHTRVISNPHVMALDNQKATIKSGDRIPINQQTIVGNTTNAVTTTSQYIDTGVLLQVTPHINEGGLVTLDVQAEVSQPRASSTSGSTADTTNAPAISTRSIQTLVAVPSGKTMVMGGLITELKDDGTNGLPFLSRLPGIGALFGSQNIKHDRAELVLFITPRVVESDTDREAIINDLRRRMESLDRVFPATSNWPASPPSYGDQLQKLLTPETWELPHTTPPMAPVAKPAGQPTQSP